MCKYVIALCYVFCNSISNRLGRDGCVMMGRKCLSNLLWDRRHSLGSVVSKKSVGEMGILKNNKKDKLHTPINPEHYGTYMFYKSYDDSE